MKNGSKGKENGKNRFVTMILGNVGNYLKITERTISRVTRVRQILVFKVGGTWKFATVDIDGRIKRQIPAGVKEA